MLHPVGVTRGACPVGAGRGDRVEYVGRIARLCRALVVAAYYVLSAVVRVRQHRVRLAVLSTKSETLYRGRICRADDNTHLLSRK